VAFTAIPAAFAQDVTEPVLPEVSICMEYPIEEILIEEPVIIVCRGVDESFETSYPIVEIEEPTGNEEEVVTEEVVDGEVVEITPEEGEWPSGGVPIDWVKRGKYIKP